MTAREIVNALGGRWHGTYGMARCPVHTDRTPSLKVRDDARKADGLDLCCFAGCSWQDVKAALRREGLLPSWEPGSAPRPDLETETRYRVEREAEEQGQIEAARALWRQARPLTQDDPAGRYLMSRGLPGPWPPSLRFLRTAPHPSGADVPALIAAACRWPGRCPVAVQLTALTPQGQKAGLKPLRWTRGALSGAAVRLAPRNHAETLVLVEGVEDGLAVFRVMPEAVPWAVLGACNAKRLILPPSAEVILVLDGDDAGRRAAQDAADALVAQGHKVKIARLPEGSDPAILMPAWIGRAA